ncbi:MAG: hypothetical protein RIS45_1572 [Planctomycetota bacterium]|jgi:hypothetical protein
MSDITIEKGVALPPKSNNQGRPVYPFQDLVREGVGSSFFVPCEGKEQTYVQQTLCALAAAYKRRSEMEFTTRKVDGGVRIWRTK